jgi:RNA polymerase sigma-70 factor (ECF subfamily)
VSLLMKTEPRDGRDGLIANHRARDPADLQDWFAHYRAALFAYFMRRLRNRADADDLVQDVFIRLSRLDPSTHVFNAEGLIFHTAANLLRDRARRAKSHRHIGELATLEIDPADEEPGVLRVLEARAELSRVIVALHALSERTRHIFVLRRLEHVRVDDIAMYYGISISAVEHHITKAQAYLAKTIKR